MIIFLAGPIDWWWNNNWETPAHIAYLDWRNFLNKSFVEAGHLVYRPHESFKGRWDERAQQVNDKAIELCDVFVYMTPEGVPAYGTDAEKDVARRLGKQILHAPPGNLTLVKNLIVPLDKPYSDMYRRSYDRVE